MNNRNLNSHRNGPDSPLKGRTIVDNGVVPTLCRQCDMRCGINVHINDGVITKISGLETHRANRGRICPKAPSALELVYHPDRLRTPLKRTRDGRWVEIAYAEAMDEIAARVQQLQANHGASAMGVWTGEGIGFQQQEDYARRFIHALGSPNYFSAESVCFAGRYIAYCLTQGYYNPCPDFENARTIVLWGSNLPHSHPPYWWDIERARKNGAKLIVVDPRRSTAASKADLHIQSFPGTDGALAWGLARKMIENQTYDHNFVDNHSLGFDRFTAYAQKFTPEFVAGETGVAEQQFEAFAQLAASGQPRVAMFVGLPLEHLPNGVQTIRAIVCLSGLLGAVDRKGGNIWPAAFTKNQLTLYDELPLEQEKPIGAGDFPVLYDLRKQCHSLTAMDTILGKGSERLKAMVITGANPVLTNPNAQKVSRAFRALDLLVVRDLFMTETARHAHYILPAATFLERSELHILAHKQLIGATTKIVDLPGVSDEFTFWRDLSNRLGVAAEYFPWSNEEELNQWLLSPSGVNWDKIRSHPEGIQYAPLVYGKYAHQKFPTSSGRFEFSSTYLPKFGFAALPEYISPHTRTADKADYPLILSSGARHPFYYNSRYRNIARFRKTGPDPEVEIHGDDAANMGIADGERVKVATRTGAIELTARILPADASLPGVIQITHGWDEANVNMITDDKDLDPVSGYPNMKMVPAKIERQ